MKKILFILLITITSTFFNNGFSQGPPPPPGGGFGSQHTGGGHGQGGNFGPQGAPIGGGLEILVLLGLTYAGNRIYKSRREMKKT